MEHLLSLQHVNKFYGDTHVLHDIDMQVDGKGVFGLLGPNGAGKTTILRLITGITAPDSGEILFNGKPLQNVHKRLIGYLPEERGLYRKMKVWDQAMYLTRLKGLAEIDAREALNDWFARLHMDAWKHKTVDTLSKGMQQRLQFVIAVAHNPELLILDEPFSGFDPIHADEIKQEILRLRDNGTTVVLSTHNMSSVEELCDTIALVHQGKILLGGNTQAVRTQFSKNLFKVDFVGSQVAFATALGHQYEILGIKELPTHIEATLKSHASFTGNELIQRIIHAVEIKGFSEALPSINDLFLDQISRAHNQQHESSHGE